MTFKTFKTLNIALVSLLSMGLAASGQSVDFEASDVVKPGSPFSSWAADTPAWNTSIDKAEVETRALEVRNPIFVSPHTRRAFAVGFSSNLIDAAGWMFDIWVEGYANTAKLEGIAVYGSNNVRPTTITVPHLHTLTLTEDQYRGAATFQMTGFVGTALLVVDFVAEVFASSAATIIQSMISPPVATLAGASIPVTSWRFPEVD